MGHDAAAVDRRRERVRLEIGGGRDLHPHELLARMRLEPVALERPATLATEEQHRRVLSRAVVLEPCRLRAALEVVLRRAGPGEQAPHRLELFGPMEVRGAGDRDLGIAQIGSRANDGQRLERLRRAPEERAELRVSAGVDDIPVGHGDSVHAMPRLDDLTAPDLDHDRLHGGGA